MCKKTLFVLGAGASSDLARTPLGHELGWDYHIQTVEVSMWVNGTSQMAPDQIRRNQEYASFLQIAQEICPSLGDLYASFHKSEGSMYIWNRPYNLPKEGYLDEMLRLVQADGNEQMASTLKRIIYKHIIGASFGIGNSGYEIFIKKVAEQKNRGKDISIISLNFDTYVREGHFLNGGFLCFDYEIIFDFIDCNRREWYLRKNSPKVPLIKPNGSFDWVFCRGCEKLGLLDWNRREEDYGRFKCLNPKCKNLVEPLICMPHDQLNERLVILQEVAAQEIQKADQIVVIGYSFPVYDTHIITLFRENVKEETSILVVDKSLDESESGRQKKKQEIERKYLTIFPRLSESDLEIYLDGFTDFLTKSDQNLL